jgi:hypothetical protein
MSLLVVAVWATELGKMTGGGSVILSDADTVAGAGSAEGIRVTHGFELYCSADLRPNRLEINIHSDGGGARFHLLTLDFANCQGTDSISPAPPEAPFYSYEGDGRGVYNGIDGYCASWRFTDRGEPGTGDEIYWLHIWDGGPDGECGSGDDGATALMIVPDGHTLTYGTHQSHRLVGKRTIPILPNIR